MRGLTRYWEPAAFTALLAAAAGLRYWHLWDIPAPTDELLGVGRGLQIARGELFPLTDFNSYIGALWNYLLAAGYLAFGSNAYVARGLPFLVGVLTVPATYLLARELAGRLAGWVAAILLATSSAHILATSHVSWSHCLAPLFGALGLWALHRALRVGDGRGLLASGLWFGLMLQIHLTMLALLPGAAAFFWLKGRSWLKTPWPYLAGLLALVLISNILLYNVQTQFGSVREADSIRAAYARPKGSGLELYVGNLQRMGVAALRTVGGAIEIRPAPRDYLLDPLVLVPSLLAIGGAALLWRRGDPLPWLAVLPYAGLLLIFNAKYETIPNSRFLTPVLPVVYACTGALLADLARRLGGRGALVELSLAMLLACLAALSLSGLARRYDQMAGSVATTVGLDALVDAVEAARRPDEPVLLDRNGLERLWTDGGGDYWLALEFDLRRRRIPVGQLPGRVFPPGSETSPCATLRVALVPIDRVRGVPDWLRPALGSAPDRLPRRFWTVRVLLSDVAPGPDERVLLTYQPPVDGSTRAVERCTPGRQI